MNLLDGWNVRNGWAARTRRTTLIATLLLATASLAGCGAMLAQNPSSPLKPVRATAVGDDASVMLDGHDLVAYFTQGRHARGTAQFKTVHRGVTFYFASAEHKALFDKEPAKYLPQYGGFCANGINYGIPWVATPTPGASWAASSTSLVAPARARLLSWTRRATSFWPTSTGPKKWPAATAFGNAASAWSFGCRTTRAAKS